MSIAPIGKTCLLTFVKYVYSIPQPAVPIAKRSAKGGPAAKDSASPSAVPVVTANLGAANTGHSPLANQAGSKEENSAAVKV